MSRPPLPANTADRAVIDDLVAAGNVGEALVAARVYWAGGAVGSAARYIQSLLPKLWPAEHILTHKVAVLRSFTVEPVIPLLQATASLDGCRIETWVGQFNTYAQEILAEDSGLYAFDPHTVIVAVQSRDISPALWRDFADLTPQAVQDEIQTVSGVLIGLLEGLRKRCSANIVFHGLETPTYPAAGLYDFQRPGGQVEAFGEINRRILAWAAPVNAVYWLDYDGLQSRHGRLRWHDAKKWASTRLPFSVDALGPMAAEWWRVLTPLALPQSKVLVVDLDNTLWGGVLGEDGLHGIKVGDEYPGAFFWALQRVILDLARRGIVLAVSSKNNEPEAMQALAEHPGMLLRPEHFSAFRINWRPKAESIAEIAAELNIGVDAIAFLDDNPAERDAVRSMLPRVRVIELPADPAQYANVLRNFSGFERLSLSSEDLERSGYYRQEQDRRAVSASAGSMEEFLHNLSIKIHMAPVDAATLTRAAQLTQKTNQLNMTTRRYTEAEMSELLGQPGNHGYTLAAQDRFGHNGIVGVAILRISDNVAEIDTFLLSCRVIGRGIESAFLAQLAQAASALGCEALTGWFLPTAKNVPAAKIYADNGFTNGENRDKDSLWRLEFAESAVNVPDWIAVVEKS